MDREIKKSIEDSIKEINDFKKDKNKYRFDTLEESKSKWSKWLKDLDIDKAVELAKESSKYNIKGQAVLSKDDDWRDNNEWNNFYDNI